jgi:peptidoglycan-N-acetylglucosamine deacetylase
MKLFLFIYFLFSSAPTFSKEIAFSFDDAPGWNTHHFSADERADVLIKKLKALEIPSVAIFSNPCNGKDRESTLRQLEKFKQYGHMIANHTCSHPRLDDVGFERFSENIAEADRFLQKLLPSQKFFRFPYLNEGRDEEVRDQVRNWLGKNGYRNGMVSIDNDDYIVSAKINEAKRLGKNIDYKGVEKIFLSHLLGAVEFYDDLAVKRLGRSPKHVLLLHEVDATVLYLDSLVNNLRANGWKIISIEEAYKDPIYLRQPKNTYANNGIISQLVMEKTNERLGYFDFDRLKNELNRKLDL